MRLKLLLSPFLFLCLNVYSFGQSNVVIPQSQVMNDSVQLQMAVISLSPSSNDLADTFGQNINYGFSNANSEDSFKVTSTKLDTTKFSDQFPKADFAFEFYETSSIFFLRQCKDTLFLLGETRKPEIAKADYWVKYDRPVTFLTFPLKYKTTFSDTLSGVIHTRDSVFRREGHVTTKVIGEGNLSSPANNYQSVLRMNFQINYRDTFLTQQDKRALVNADVTHDRFYSQQDTGMVAAFNGGKVTTAISNIGSGRTLAGSYFRYDSDIPNKIIDPGITNDTLSVETCNRFQLPSGERTVTTSGTYYDTIERPCKGARFFKINLTVNTVDTGVERTSEGLKAEIPGADYQWLDCDQGYQPINGANSRDFEPSSNGDYAVEVTKNNCTDTSNCYSIKGTGLTSNNNTPAISLYPNPVSNVLKLKVQDMDNRFTNMRYKLNNLTGKTIRKGHLKSESTNLINVESLPKGVYIFKLSYEDGQINRKVVIQ